MHVIERPVANRLVREAASYAVQFSNRLLGGAEGVVVVIATTAPFDVEVFLDESGTDANTPYATVAAVWARPAEWSAWTTKWLLAKAPIRVHHSVDCHNLKGEYEGWNRVFRRDPYVVRLLDVIRDSSVQFRVAAVDKSGLRKAFAARPEVMAALGGDFHYRSSLQWTLERTWDRLEKEGFKNILFVHETNQYAAIASETFASVESRHPNTSGTFVMAGKGKFVPLQCADILAFEGYRQMKDQSKERLPLSRIDPFGMRLQFIYHDEEGYTTAAKKLIEWVDRKRAELGG